MRYLPILAISLALAVGLGGCGNLEKAILGKYEMKVDAAKLNASDRAAVEAMGPMLKTVTLELQSDHTAVMMAMGDAQNGVWKLEGDELTVTPKNDAPSKLTVIEGGKTLLVDPKESRLGNMRGALLYMQKVP